MGGGVGVGGGGVEAKGMLVSRIEVSQQFLFTFSSFFKSWHF